MARAVSTWITFAFIHIVLAIDADDARYTNAFVAAGIFIRKWFGENRGQCIAIGQSVQRYIGSLQASAVVLAWRTLTLVDVDFAIFARVSNVAIAL